MKPLYAIKYIRSNKKKSFSVIACIAAAVFLLYSFQILMSSLHNCYELIYGKPQEKFSAIYPSNNNTLDDLLIDSVKNHKNVEKVIPFVSKYTLFNNGTMNTGVTVYSMDIEDMNYYMNSFHIKLKEGRLPSGSNDEIILDYRLANNKNLKLNDIIGNEVQRSETLKGKYKIVGITEGTIISALTLSDKSLDKNTLYKYGMLVFPKKDKLEEVTTFLNTNHYGTKVISYKSVQEEFDSIFDSTNKTINILAALLIAALSISVGNICYVHFFQRRKEFGTLSALGYSRSFLIKRAFYEIALMNLIGFILGLLLSIFVGLVLKIIFINTAGITVSLLLKTGLIQCSCIPIFTTLLALKPINFMIKRVDAVSMIEGVD